MADVLTPPCISSKSMDELEAILSEDDDVDHHHNDEEKHGEGEDYQHEGEELEQLEPPPPIRMIETTESNFTIHIGDLELPSVESYPEVVYEKSTPLFTAIEHTKWREAYQLAKEFPQQITTWVISQNTEQPTLGMSLWRRLPLHEACRRQAPAWLVAQLISAAPESVQCKTQFGEYPLHLAVECAATPEVVHVLVVAHWPAVIARDNGGRTPLDILEETELLQSPSGDSEEGARFADISEAKIIYQSLERSQQTYLKMLEKHVQQKSELELKHEQHVVGLKQEHAQQLQQERVNQTTLEEKLERLKGANMALQHEVAKKDSKMLAFKNLESIYQDRVEEQKATAEVLRSEMDQKDEEIKQLQKALQDKDAQILQERERAAGLSHDVWHMTRLHDTQLQDVLQQAENALQSLVHCQLAVHGQWLGQHRALHHILKQRGIPEPTPSAPIAHSETPAGIAAASAATAAAVKAGKAKDEEREIMEEKKNEEEPMDANSAAQVAAAAALHALQSADDRGADSAAAAEAREQPIDGAVVAATGAAVESEAASEKKELKIDSVVPGDGEKGKTPSKARKGGNVPAVGNEGDNDDEEDDDDSDEEEDGEDSESDEDDDDDDEEYDSQEDTDEDSGSDDETSDEDDEEFSGDEGEHAEDESTLLKTDAWKKQ